MMNEHPILFSGEMVKAILDGRKTQTRRVIPESLQLCQSPEDEPERFIEWCKYGQPGDLLWVRETFAYDLSDRGNQRRVSYKADGSGICSSVRDFDTGERYELPWRPSIFMPRWASRITLEVVSVQVERVQEISRPDIKAEGVCLDDIPYGEISDKQARSKFWVLWDTINSKRGYGWDTNPFVWVVKFKKLTPCA